MGVCVRVEFLRVRSWKVSWMIGWFRRDQSQARERTWGTLGEGASREKDQHKSAEARVCSGLSSPKALALC